VIDVDVTEMMPIVLVGVLSDGFVEAVLDDLGSIARARWIQEAQQELHATRQDYISGISEVQAQPGVRFVTLEGWLPNAVENGLDEYDLRETLLHGPSARQSAAGYAYAYIPFRHGTPGSTGLAGTPMGMAYAAAGENSRSGGPLGADQARQFGAEIYKRAKRLRGRRMTESQVQRAFGEGSVLLRPHHKSSIYAGMVRGRKSYKNEKTGKTTTQSQYTTFRTISERVTEGWIHPGITARHLSARVADYLRTVAPRVISRALAMATRR
jgi:hypothetical protein